MEEMFISSKHSRARGEIDKDKGQMCNAWAVAGAVVGSAVIGGYMSNKAAGAQADAANNATAAQTESTRLQLEQQQKMYDQNVARMQPFVEAGQGSLAQLKAGLAQGGQFQQTFKPSDLTTDPSYQWRLQQGQRALQSSAAARGTLMTGQGLADINNYAQGAASQEYQSAYDRFMNNQNTLFNRLQTMAGSSQNAAGGLGALGSQVASGMAGTLQSGTAAANDLRTSGAAAQAAGYVGTANAITGGVGMGIRAWQNQQYLNSLKPGQPGGVGTTGVDNVGFGGEA